jgi:uncharacterized membrane protein YczE
MSTLHTIYNWPHTLPVGVWAAILCGLLVAFVALALRTKSGKVVVVAAALVAAAIGGNAVLGHHTTTRHVAGASITAGR